MNRVEKELKAKLEESVLQTPSLDLDEKVEALIREVGTPKINTLKNQWKNWSVAASVFAVVVIGVLVSKVNVKDPLQLAFEESFKLEQQIKQQKSSILQPVFFLEENKLNLEISEIDRQLQLLLMLEDSNAEVSDLLRQRVVKLKLLKDLYQTNQPVYRI